MSYTPLPKAKIFAVFFLSTFLTFFSFAQCDTDIQLNSQAEVDAFDCTIVNGSLTINGADITDLGALSSLQEVGNSLIIADNPLLSSLSGLENLTIIPGVMVVVQNPILISLDGLNGLRSLGSAYMDTNASLRSISALSGISGEVESFVSFKNSALESLEGLENITRSNGSLDINGSPLITNLDGLSSLQSVGSNLNLIDCPALTDISGLRNLTRTGSNLIIVQTGLTQIDGLEQVEEVGGHLVFEDNPELENLDGLIGLVDAFRLTIFNNPKLTDCCGLYNMIAGAGAPFVGRIGDNGNPDCNSLINIVEGCRASAPIDLELSMSIAPNQPDAFTFFTQTVTLVNQGPSLATRVEVNIPRPAGVVYQGGNEFTATAGVFDTWNTFNWSIGRMRPGASATIRINYYKLNSDDLTFYAEVAEAEGIDLDSSPGNGTSPTPNEDDEAAATTGQSLPLPDLSLSQLDAPGSGMTGNVVNFTFDLNNSGNIEVQGAYTIGAYLSVDNQLSSDDLLGGTIPTGNTPKGTLSDIPGAIAIPSSLSPGTYFIILKADIDDEIAEQNENNNLSIVPINISTTPRICTGDFIIRSQAELDQLIGCEIIEGDLDIGGFAGATDNVMDLTPLVSLKEVTESFLLQNTEVHNTEGLNNLERVKRLIILQNQELTNIDALNQLRGQVEVVVLIGNPVLESLVPLSGLEGDSMQTVVITGNHTLRNIDGMEGVREVNFLDMIGNDRIENYNGLRNLSRVNNSILLVDNDQVTNMSGFSGLESVGADFVIADHAGLRNVNGLGNLKSVGGVMVVFGSDQVTNLNGLSNLDSAGALTIAENLILEDCCGIYDLLNENRVSGAIRIEDNPAFCSSVQDILDNCGNTTGDIDLELSLSTDVATPAAFTFFSKTVTLTNKGPKTATGVWVDVPAPAGTVYQGGNEFEASQGNFRFWGPQDWEVGELAAGETATLTINYYLLSNDAITFYGEVSAANEVDGDSTPGNGIAPTPNEDDEAATTINLNSSPDLTLSNYEGPNDGFAGDTINFNFDLNNIGNQVAIGSYTIRIFLSEDDQLSADDIVVGFVQTGNTPVGTIAEVSSSASLPNSVAAGEYQLIFVADATEQIAEADESNNQLLVPFNILGSSNSRQVAAKRSIRIGQFQEIVIERLYPNPAERFFTMEFSALTPGVLPLVIYDALGTAVLQQQLSLQEGSNRIVLDVGQLQAGIYYVRFQIPYRHEAIRFVKVRD